MLFQFLPAPLSTIRSLRNLHQLCVAETLGDFQSVLFDFQTNFEFLYEEFNLPMTLKIHVIIDHYSDYFMWTGRTMKYTNAEFTETAHSTFKMSERIHKGDTEHVISHIKLTQ